MASNDAASALVEAAMVEARTAAQELVERRLRGLQRKVIAPKDREIAELRQRLAAYEQEENTNDV